MATQLNSQDVIVCRSNLFGATSSPSCSIYALKQTADDNAHLFEPEVVSTVKIFLCR